MKETARNVSLVAVLLVGILLGYANNSHHHDDAPAPRPVLSDATVTALTEALNNLPPRDQLTERQQAVVDAANDIADELEGGDVTVTHQTTTTVAPPARESGGAQGEPPPTTRPPATTTTTTAPVARPGSVLEPLMPHGITPPTTQAP